MFIFHALQSVVCCVVQPISHHQTCTGQYNLAASLYHYLLRSNVHVHLIIWGTRSQNNIRDTLILVVVVVPVGQWFCLSQL